MSIRRIAFVGLGNMGWPMAANLAAAGFDLTVFDIRRDVLAGFGAAYSARIATSPRELGSHAECIIMMLPDHKAVKQAVLGQASDCIAAGLEPGHLIVDMGTSDPNATRELGATLSVRGVHVIDAPVMGGVVFARDRTLDIMAGGDAASLERLAPVFAAMGRKVFHCGPLGNAHALKAVNNYVNASCLASVLEGLVMGRKLGLDTQTLIESMQAMCTGRNHPLEKKVIPHILTEKYATGMSIGLIAKDLGIAVDAAREAGAAAPLAEQLLGLWRNAAATLGAARDQTEIVRYWEQASAVRLQQ